jgi:succinylarginine dihydrolase
MKPETKKLMEEMADDYLQQSYPASHYEKASERIAYHNGFTAAHTLAEQEIAELKAENKNIKLDYGQVMLIKEDYFKKIQDLTASLKSANDSLNKIDDHIRLMHNEGTISMKEMIRALKVLSDSLAKNPDMFKGEV